MLNVELVEQPEQTVLSIRTRTRVEDLPGLIGASYHRIMALLEAHGIAPAGAPYTAYYNQDMSDLDVEMGFPVAGPCPDEGNVRCHTLPAGRAVVTQYQGPYAGLTEAYAAMAGFMADNRLEPDGTAYEYYLTGPDVPETEHITRIVMPLR